MVKGDKLLIDGVYCQLEAFSVIKFTLVTNEWMLYDVEKTVVDIVFFREKAGIEETKEILVNEYCKLKNTIEMI